MRVLAVGNMYPPHHLGGYELVWRSAMRHLRDGGHSTRMLSTDFSTATGEPDEPDTYRQLRWYWHAHEFPKYGWRERVTLERHNGAVLDAHLRAFDPDVVSWWPMGGMSLSLLERIRRTGLPSVAFVADDWLLYGPVVDAWTRPLRRPRLAAIAERLTGLPVLRSLDDVARYVLISETVRTRAREAGLALPGSEIAPLGIDPAFLDPRPARPWSGKLLYVGRLDERKGVADAVTALAALDGDTTLQIAGDGDPRERERIEALISRLGLAGRVTLLGMLSHAQLPTVYDAADAVLFPVRWLEPQGLVPLEAMAFGRPVVATGMGGSADYLRDRENCLLVAPADPAALAAAIGELAADPALRARLRDGGLHTSARYTEPSFNARVLAALEAACRRSPR